MSTNITHELSTAQAAAAADLQMIVMLLYRADCTLTTTPEDRAELQAKLKVAADKLDRLTMEKSNSTQ